LEQFKEIIIAHDNDESGLKFVKEVVPRLGSWRCKIVNIPEYYEDEEGKKHSVKDINEMLYFFGKDKVLEAIVNAQDSPVPSLVDFADVEDVDLTDIDGIRFGIDALDKELMRLFYGSFTIISGTPGSGKTSFLYQLICQALDQEKNCWVYSKELPAWMSRNWLMYLLAGRRHLVEYVSPEGATYYRVKPEAKKKISDFYRGKLMLYKDDWSNDVKSIQDSMIDSVRKYGSKLFLLDNMTTIDLGANDDNKWQKQTELVNWLIQFSMKYNVCTILVCHPRKMQDLTENVGLYELSGTANLINLAHRAISLRRIGKKEKAGIPNAKGDGWVKPSCPYDVVVSVQKDRLRGRANLECGLYYDVPSRRFFTKPEEFEHNYAWDTTEYIDHVPYPVVDTEEEIFGK
jgi:twinkle protein